MGGFGRLVFLAMAVVAILSSGSAFAAGPPPLSVYGKLPGVERVSVSPSGDHIAMVGMVEDVRRLVVLDQGKKSLVAFPLGDAKIRGIYWAGEDRILVYRSSATKLDADFRGDGTVELFSMLVIPLNGEKPWTVFGNNERIAGGVTWGFYGVQEREGRYYGYFSGLTYQGDFRSPELYLSTGGPTLYEVDLQSQKATEIGPRFQGRGYRDWVMAPDGKISATLDFASTTGNWVIRNAAGDRIREGVNPLGRIELLGLGATPGTVILGEEEKAGEPRWLELPLAGGEATRSLDGISQDNAFFEPRSRQLVGYLSDGSIPNYSFFDPYRQKVVNAMMKAFPGSLVELKDWNAGFDHLVAMTEGPGDPQTWWMVDIKSGKASELGFSYPIAGADVGPMKLIQYKAGDGLGIEGVLTLPPGRQPKNLPVIILPHGGPADRDQAGFEWWAQAFASRGYAVLQPNFRGSTGYGAVFQHAGDGQWGRKMQNDISDGLAYLVTQGIVDPKRACIMGASYGGYAALVGVTLQNGLYRCAVAVSGVSDVAKWAVALSAAGADRTMKRVIETEIGAGKDLRAVSPINFAAQADAPILLIHGKDDSVVPYDQSNDMATALRKAGKPVEFVTLSGEDHWLSRGETRLAMLEAAVRFVEAHNPSDSAP